MRERYLAIDLGTTSVKAGVFSSDGTLLAHVRQTYPTHRSEGGRCEQDPADWTRLIDKAVNGFHQRFAPETFAAGALTSQINTHVFVGRDGAPLMPAILWQDTRAEAEAAELDRLLSEADKIAWLGAPIPIDASHLLARMLWTKRHRPDVWDRTSHVLLPKDYALLHLTGALATDPLSNVGVVGVDGRYVENILNLVPGATERMAPLCPITDIMASTRQGVPMAVATLDGWVGLMGTGACAEGSFVYLSGTSEILGVASRTVTHAPGIIVFNEAGGLKLHAGPTQSGGASQVWFADLAGLSFEALAASVAALPSSRRTPLFLPQLAGERAPIWNAGLRGAFLGLESGMGTGDLAKAVYEGVALSARHVFEAVEASAGQQAEWVACGGGGFHADPWGQIRADVLGKPMKRLAITDTGLVGAACIAAVAAGDATTLWDAQRAYARFDTTFEPNHALRGRYDDLFGIYLDAIEAHEAIGNRLRTL
ncbi:MAG: FGGY family carbohydrate kinase [Pseudomonadota bacterium]